MKAAGNEAGIPDREAAMISDTPVGTLTRHLDGCVKRNHAQDVLDVMDALETDFMPVVDDFAARRVIGVITRWELARLVRKFGMGARVEHGTAGLLPTVSHNTPADQVVVKAGSATAYVVVGAEGRLKGIYRPGSRAERP